VSSDRHVSDAKVPDYDASVREYHASRARYIRSVTADTEKKLMETVAKRRDPLKANWAPPESCCPGNRALTKCWRKASTTSRRPA